MKTTPIVIYGQDWIIKYPKRHKLFKKVVGWANHTKNEIVIQSKLPETQQKSIILHELIHIITEANDIDLTETETKALESGLFSVIDFELR